MNEISFDIDSDLRILSWNDRMESFTGKPPRMVLGKKYYEFFPRIMYRDIDAVRETLNRQRTLSIKDHLFVCPFGHLRSSVRISPVKVNRAKAKHVTITMKTLTPCSLAKQWNRSQKFLAIGKIASSLAHGVQNPLNAIKGAVVYLRDRYADEKPLIEFTEIMESEISRLEHFIIPRSLKKLDPNLMIALITGWGETIDSAHLQESGIDTIVNKPFRMDQILGLAGAARAKRLCRPG